MHAKAGPQFLQEALEASLRAKEAEAAMAERKAKDRERKLVEAREELAAQSGRAVAAEKAFAAQRDKVRDVWIRSIRVIKTTRSQDPKF